MIAVEYIDGEFYREEFETYADAAKFIMLAGGYVAPVSLRQIIHMLKVSRKTGWAVMGSWFATG